MYAFLKAFIIMALCFSSVSITVAAILTLLLKNERAHKRDKMFGQYPCDLLLHNALNFIIGDRVDAAYQEICYAILKSGGELTDEEYMYLEMIRDKGSDERGKE